MIDFQSQTLIFISSHFFFNLRNLILKILKLLALLWL